MPAHNKKLAFLLEPYSGRTGSQAIRGFNKSLSLAGLASLRHQGSSFILRLGQALDRMGLLRNLIKLPGKAYLVALMWPRAARLFPVGYTHEIIPFCFDCWPADYPKWKQLFNRHRVRIAFFTAGDSARYFQKLFPEMSCYWIPEATDPSEYDARLPLAERDIDVLEFGRRWEQYHEAITTPLNESGYRHLYRTPNRRVFPDTRSLREGLGTTKVSICFPKSITHPERAENLETVTFRYFESMASKTLIVGHGPAELERIFGYNPVINADPENPWEQICGILSNIAEYQPLVDKNYERLLEVGTWSARTQDIMTILEARHYSS